MAKKSELVGMDDLERSFKALGKVPQTVATQSANAGASVALKAAKANAPEDEGNLKRGLIKKKERRTKLGKAVYDILPSPHFNDVFVKISEDGKRSYYPASQEYGWLTESGKYIPGYHYLRRAVTEHEKQIEHKVLEKAEKAIDKAMKKGR